MTLKTITRTLNGEELIFTNQRALYWPRENALVLSDLHVGKTAYFRKNGIPVPSDILNDDLGRLQELILHFGAGQVIIVGDFLHAGKNSDFRIFEEWQLQFPELQFKIIKGNHDVFRASFLERASVTVSGEELKVHPFTFIHIPLGDANTFSISGHLHPGVTIKLERNKYISLPCFRYSENQLILPAFSKFTGLDTKSCRDFHCIAFSENLIFDMDGSGNLA